MTSESLVCLIALPTVLPFCRVVGMLVTLSQVRSTQEQPGVVLVVLLRKLGERTNCEGHSSPSRRRVYHVRVVDRVVTVLNFLLICTYLDNGFFRNQLVDATFSFPAFAPSSFSSLKRVSLMKSCRLWTID